MSKFSDFLNALSTRFGLTIIPTWRLDQYGAAEHLSRLFSLRDVDLVIDVGANAGQFRDFLRLHVGYKRWIASYEPIPEVYKTLLQRSNDDEYWRVFNLALGSTQGHDIFNVSIGSTLSSFGEPDFNATDHASSRRQTQRKIDVGIDTIDRQLPILFQTLAVKVPYLKMDTQGYDLEVLRGAESSLVQFVGLQFEGSVVPLYQDMPHFTDMLNYLNKRGFVLSDMFAVTKDLTMRLIEFDCVMVNSRPHLSIP